MKKITILAFLLFPLSMKAQQLFGSTHKAVRDTMIRHNLIYINSKNANDGSIYDMYQDEEGTVSTCYFNKHDVCFEVRKFYAKKTLMDELDYLNEIYVKTGNKIWINKSKTVSVTLVIPENDDTYFSVSFDKLDLMD